MDLFISYLTITSIFGSNIEKYVYAKRFGTTVESRYLELSWDQQICSRHREFDLPSSYFV